MTDTRPETTAHDYTALFAQALQESTTQDAPVLRPVPAQASPAGLLRASSGFPTPRSRPRSRSVTRFSPSCVHRPA